MNAEAAPLVERLGLTKDAPGIIVGPAPCVCYSGDVSGVKVHLIQNGTCDKHGVDLVGTVPAALVAYLALQSLRPQVLLSTGTAGGFAGRGAKIGSIFLSSQTVNHDRRIPLPGFSTYGVGALLSLPCPRLAAALGFGVGVVTSGNSLDYHDRDMESMLHHGAVVKEMEAAGAAWSAALFKTPFLCLKSVTDIVDGTRPAQEEFMENLGIASEALREAVPRVLEFMAGKKYSEL
ncbi:hypothetical protein H632_c472p1 [Helicosporidium sp. ATCC 50920]|nr:hypothetical protein H632_c472p1 [Helicosporidium sp. ATCC 50920]|eukprot:KDD75848.1 hypothetical protein H632_c472p1 [Helicosporidium sp. ATCC 50920]